MASQNHSGLAKISSESIQLTKSLFFIRNILIADLIELLQTSQNQSYINSYCVDGAYLHRTMKTYFQRNSHNFAICQ